MGYEKSRTSTAGDERSKVGPIGRVGPRVEFCSAGGLHVVSIFTVYTPMKRSLMVGGGVRKSTCRTPSTPGEGVGKFVLVELGGEFKFTFEDL